MLVPLSGTLKSHPRRAVQVCVWRSGLSCDWRLEGAPSGVARLRYVDGQLDLTAELERDRFERRTADGGRGSRGELLVASEVAALLRVTTAWVYAETRANRLPHVRLGRYVRYRAAAIDAWVAEEERRVASRSRG
jgi:excisionase family DNA binding protein